MWTVNSYYLLENWNFYWIWFWYLALSLSFLCICAFSIIYIMGFSINFYFYFHSNLSFSDRCLYCNIIVICIYDCTMIWLECNGNLSLELLDCLELGLLNYISFLLFTIICWFCWLVIISKDNQCFLYNPLRQHWMRVDDELWN